MDTTFRNEAEQEAGRTPLRDRAGVAGSGSGERLRLVDMTPDRQALKAMEDADRHAEACRQDWVRVCKAITDTATLVQAGLNYAAAANEAHLAREAYSDLVMDAMETERMRERIAELAI